MKKLNNNVNFAPQGCQVSVYIAVVQMLKLQAPKTRETVRCSW